VVRGEAAAVGKQFAAVLEQHHPVTQQAPALFGLCDDDDGGRAVGAGGRGAGRLVLAGGAHGVLAGVVAAGTCFSIASSAQSGNETITYAGTCFWYLGMRALARLVGPCNAGFHRDLAIRSHP
jgi:hypothetical protein